MNYNKGQKNYGELGYGMSCYNKYLILRGMNQVLKEKEEHKVVILDPETDQHRLSKNLHS